MSAIKYLIAIIASWFNEANPSDQVDLEAEEENEDA